MSSPNFTPNKTPELPLAQNKVHEIILDGLRHGHFEITVGCETIQQGKRRLSIKAGKSHQFIISKEELEI